MTVYDPLDLQDIQGNVLRGYAFPFAGTLFVRVGEPAAGRAWLGTLVDAVTDASPWTHGKPLHTLNIAFSCPGLRAFGVPEKLLETFSGPFRQGMPSRASLLGDIGPSDPADWEPGVNDDVAHVVLMVWGREKPSFEQRMAALRAEVEAGAPHLSVVNEQHAALLPFGREHFGFSDGFSQPAVQYSGARDVKGQGTPNRLGGWRDVAAGEFILGYEDEDEVLPDAPAAPLGVNGTYMVYRKLHQDVALWRRFLREDGSRFPGGSELLAAKIVGRWPDGTPLVLSPDGEDPLISGDPTRTNDFRYRNDPGGFRCPIGAHIRRANPRDSLGWGGARSRRHRLIRRAVPYGPPLPEGVEEPDGVDRGLMFICFNADIERQFEKIQGQWLADGNIFGLGNDRDFLLGAPGPGKMTIEGHPPYFLSPNPPLVVTRGGAYFFLPGIDALRALAGNLEDWA